MEHLIGDPDPEVRSASARHPNLPQARLVELLADEELAHAAAANPVSDAAMMHRLLHTRGRYFR
ncbi:hypothetical protein AB0L59_37655 [Streptomyces sp. NPDC052109]|uniref:hypothetical protein n=1 Tax=Streptomyces sp. NPDC052109 TaxID=3155527 RepID=UPI0034222AFF